MFMANLNVFLCLFALSFWMGSGPVAAVISLLLIPIGGARGSLAFLLAYAVILAVLVFFWWRYGLSPKAINPERKRRHRIGHWLIGSLNILILCAFLVPLALAKLTGNHNLGMLMWFSLPAVAAGFILWPIGLFMVWSSRA